MVKLLPVKYTSKTALYILTTTVCIFALAYMALVNTYDYAEMTEITFKTQPGANNGVSICGLDAVVCPNEGVESKVREIAEKENFKWPDYLVRLGKCESGLNPQAQGDGGYNSRGLFQISSYYHPEVSDDCAYDIDCSTKWTMDKINAGQQNLWTCNRLI